MSDEISLLPDELRKKEEELKQTKSTVVKPSDIKFSVPADEQEDVEVIEIDEGDVDQVLAGEPPLSRFLYKISSTFDELKAKLFQPKAVEPPPKLPPQFFTPPPAKSKPAVPSVVTPSAEKVSTIAAPAPVVPASPAKPKATIKPFETVPRRVRVIKRVRKPVRVSFVSEDDLRLQHIDISRRKFTFVAATILFACLIGGGAYFLQLQALAANGELAKANAQLADIRSQIQTKQGRWAAFQDLQPHLKALTMLLDQHISPTRLFDELEKNTLPTVSYQSFSLSPDKKVTLQAVANSFGSAAQQVALFSKRDFVKKVEATNYSAKYEPPEATSPTSVTFQMVLTLTNAALFANNTVATTAP